MVHRRIHKRLEHCARSMHSWPWCSRPAVGALRLHQRSVSSSDDRKSRELSSAVMDFVSQISAEIMLTDLHTGSCERLWREFSHTWLLGLTSNHHSSLWRNGSAQLSYVDSP